MARHVNGKPILRRPMSNAAVNAILKDACDKAGYPDLYPKISWDFNVRFTNKLGRACYNRAGTLWSIELSSKLFSLADDWEREDTIRHEVAHLVIAMKYADRCFLPKRDRRRIMPHGDEWQAMAVKVGAIPRACSKKIEGSDAIRPNRRRFMKYCGCGEHPVTKTIARRMITGKYSCGKCKRFLQDAPYHQAPQTPAPQAPCMAADTIMDDSAMRREIDRLKRDNARLRGSAPQPSAPKKRRMKKAPLSPAMLDRVLATVTTSGISNQDVRSATGLSGPDTHRYLHALIAQGKVRKSGSRWSTRYHSV